MAKPLTLRVRITPREFGRIVALSELSGVPTPDLLGQAAREGVVSAEPGAFRQLAERAEAFRVQHTGRGTYDE